MKAPRMTPRLCASVDFMQISHGSIKWSLLNILILIYSLAQADSARIADREDDYRKRRLNRIIAPASNDAFAMGDRTPDAR